jgi:oxygen-independent coproporphyrinogen-3 oxidase
MHDKAVMRVDVVPSIYVHVPFCVSRCTYCDFYSIDLSILAGTAARGCGSLAGQRQSDWLAAVGQHLRQYRSDGLAAMGQADPLLVGSPPTIYLGGGTPSALPAALMDQLLSLLAAGMAHVAPVRYIEWTVECNPDDLDRSYLDLLNRHGVNRLSLGVQSLEEPARRAVQRRGSRALITKALELVAEHWPGTWSADFMYGMPGQTSKGLASDLCRVLDLGATHLSLYQLTLEPSTVLARQIACGEIAGIDHDNADAQYQAAKAVLLDRGFVRYEVSNWSLPGYECQHNLRYWMMEDWLALGPSGVSNINMAGGYERIHNQADLDSYCANPLVAMERIAITGTDAMFETLMMALRTASGLNLARFAARHGCEAGALFGDLPGLFPDHLRLDGGCWIAGDRGMDMLNAPLLAALESVAASEPMIPTDHTGRMQQ